MNTKEHKADNGQGFCKSSVIPALLLLILTVVTGCASVETITENPGNYMYSLNEEIKIIDIDTRETIGTLVFTGTDILRDEDFTLTLYKETDDDGNRIYEDLTYRQLVQINYIFRNTVDSAKEITFKNFSIKNSDAIINPDTSYTEKPHTGSCFVVALRERTKALNVDFTYDILQTRSTAKVSLSLNGEEGVPAATDTHPGTTQQETADPIETSEASGATEGSPECLPEDTTEQIWMIFEKYLSYRQVLSIAGILVFVSVALTVALILTCIALKRERKKHCIEFPKS